MSSSRMLKSAAVFFFFCSFFPLTLYSLSFLPLFIFFLLSSLCLFFSFFLYFFIYFYSPATESPPGFCCHYIGEHYTILVSPAIPLEVVFL